MAVNEQDTELNWPVLDFSRFPNNMISGLSLSDINDVMSLDDDEFIRSLFKEDDCRPTQTTTCTRFAAPVSDVNLELRKLENIPKGTRNRDKWALNIYTNWFRQRSITEGDSTEIPIPCASSLHSSDVSAIDYWFAKFILEVRKKDGLHYPRNTLISLIAGLNSHLAPSN